MIEVIRWAASIIVAFVGVTLHCIGLGFVFSSNYIIDIAEKIQGHATPR